MAFTIAEYNDLQRQYAALNGQSFDQNNIDKAVVPYSFNTCGIEGNSFTLNETERFLNTGQKVPGKSIIEHNELSDMKRAFKLAYQFGLDHVPFTQSLIMAIHKEVLRTSMPENAGIFKQVANRVDEYSTPYPAKAKEMFTQVITRVNEMWGKDHPLHIASLLHWDTVIIHPFQDGNGRIARLLMNYVLISNGHPLLDILKSDREDYILAIKKSREAKSVQPFEDYVIDRATRSLAEKVTLLENKPKIA